ncbi:MAG: hypothetical protein KAS32_03820 [Candidatus Peribacteraceae bacterium]|nr:hypothetical protein [Candidatus Peribacteraceae bacterium]
MKRKVFFIGLLFLVGCSGGNYNSNIYEESGYIGNPYSDGTGHFAGYEWAERTGGSCNGNSTSFNEGCEEFYSQIRNR